MTEKEKRMVETMHKAAQYLAMAGKTYLQEKSDDSHTNLEWLPKKRSLVSRDLNDRGIRLAINYKQYALEILTDDELLDSVALTGETHSFLINWIDQGLKRYGLKDDYRFEPHYILPYENALNNEYQFPAPNADKLQDLINQRNICEEALRNVLSERKDASDIRVWPHHFDTGALIEVDEDNHGFTKSIGLGISIPDSMIDGFYLYASPWSKGQELDLSNLDEDTLSSGEWRNEEWKGATLKTSNVSVQDATNFFQEAIQELLLVLR